MQAVFARPIGESRCYAGLDQAAHEPADSWELQSYQGPGLKPALILRALCGG